MAQTVPVGVPVVVDIDGTLVKSNLLIESALKFVKQSPLALWWMLRWLLVGGKAHLKSQIASRVDLDVSQLPFCQEILNLCSAAREQGQRVVLATGAAAKYAQAIGRLLTVDSVLATTEQHNLTGRAKLDAILLECPDGKFLYAGNEAVDMHIWRRADAAVVCGGARLAHAAASVTRVHHHVLPRPQRMRMLAKAVRLHQWSKNVLVFLPFLPLASSLPAATWLLGVAAFVAFGLCASSVYLVNDLFDLDADRAHPRKRHRPIAAGDFSLGAAIGLAALLLVAAFLLAMVVLPPLFMGVLALYWALTTAYSLDLKKRVNVDVLALACLYTLRVLAGAAVLAIAPSFWMLAFSIFLFLSLAAAKRVAELESLVRRRVGESAPGRGYQVRDMPVLTAQGAASGQLAVLVFALYLNTVLSQQFRHPEVLWAVCPLLLLWINRVWMKVSRGELHDDPVVFALRDNFSRAVAVVAVLCVAIAV